jgi:hypothetical protein
VQRRKEAEQQPSHQRDADREESHTPVERRNDDGRTGFVGDAGNVAWDEKQQPANACDSQAQTEYAATPRQ